MSHVEAQPLPCPHKLPRTSRRRLAKLLGAGVAATLAGAGLALKGSPARAENAISASPFSCSPVVGSWYLHVLGLAGPIAGQKHETLASFQVGGIMVESDNESVTAHFGSWQTQPDGSHRYTLVEFYYDPATGNVAQIVVPQIGFVLDSANTLHSISSQTTIYVYDPIAGTQINKVVIPNVSQVTGQRLATNWTPPMQF